MVINRQIKWQLLMQKYNEEIQLKDILIKISDYRTFLFRKKFAIFIGSIFFSLIGALIVISSDSQYNAELTFVVESDNKAGSLSGMSGVASQFGFNLGSIENTTFSQSNVIELLKSRGVVQSALMQNARINNKTDLLIEHYLQIHEIKEDWEREEIESISFHEEITYTHDSITGEIWNKIIKEDLIIDLQTDEANIVRLSYISLDQEFAKAFVEVLIGEMIKMYISHQTAQANNTLNFLQKRADSVFLELEVAEQDFARIKDINQRIVKASGRLKELQLMRRVEVLNTMYLELVKNLELSKITLLNQTPIINIIDKPILPLEDENHIVIFGVFLGGFFGFLLSIFFFIFSKLFKDAISED